MERVSVAPTAYPRYDLLRLTQAGDVIPFPDAPSDDEDAVDSDSESTDIDTDTESEDELEVQTCEPMRDHSHAPHPCRTIVVLASILQGHRERETYRLQTPCTR